MTFLGRRALRSSDFKFLGYLKQLAADEVIHARPRWFGGDKIDDYLFNRLKQAIQREEKLYNADEGACKEQEMAILC
jgi:hypothetical protein